MRGYSARPNCFGVRNGLAERLRIDGPVNVVSAHSRGEILCERYACSIMSPITARNCNRGAVRWAA